MNSQTSNKIVRVRAKVMSDLWKKIKALKKKGYEIHGYADSRYITYRVCYRGGWVCDYLVEVNNDNYEIN